MELAGPMRQLRNRDSAIRLKRPVKIAIKKTIVPDLIMKSIGLELDTEGISECCF